MKPVGILNNFCCCTSKCSNRNNYFYYRSLSLSNADSWLLQLNGKKQSNYITGFGQLRSKSGAEQIIAYIDKWPLPPLKSSPLLHKQASRLSVYIYIYIYIYLKSIVIVNAQTVRQYCIRTQCPGASHKQASNNPNFVCVQFCCLLNLVILIMVNLFSKIEHCV